jgi:cytidylate kinase
MIIAIDGPAASGKGTLARRLARHFNLNHLDTGSLYRAVALQALRRGDPSDPTIAETAAREFDAPLLQDPRLREERVSDASSIVAAIPGVRSALLAFQRDFAHRSPGAVLDGRDIGTIVCPEADIKFFLVATLEARALRRTRELQASGAGAIYQRVLEDMKARDARDEARRTAPLRAAADAVAIETSLIGADAVFAAALEAIAEQQAVTKR